MRKHKHPPQGTQRIISARQEAATRKLVGSIVEAIELSLSDPVVGALAAAKRSGDQEAIAAAMVPFLARYGRGKASLRLFKLL